MKDYALLAKLFLQEQWLCTSNSAEVPDTQGYVKRRWSDDCERSVKIIQKFEKAGSFDMQSGGRKKLFGVRSLKKLPQQCRRSRTVVWNLTVHGELLEHWTGLWVRCIKFFKTSCIAVLTKLAACRNCFPLTCQHERRFLLNYLLAWKWTKNCRGIFFWTDESHFHQAGYVNTQTYRIRATENPLETQSVPLHPAGWRKFIESFIIGPYFFVVTGAFDPVIVTVTGERYECLLRNHVISSFQQRECVDRAIFMQDGAPQYIANAVKQMLKQNFRNAGIISHYFPTTWLSRSPDLNLCDFRL